MTRPPYDELWELYTRSQDEIADLASRLKSREMDILLLQNDIDELEEILYTHGIFQHFDFD